MHFQNEPQAPAVASGKMLMSSVGSRTGSTRFRSPYRFYPRCSGNSLPMIGWPQRTSLSVPIRQETSCYGSTAY